MCNPIYLCKIRSCITFDIYKSLAGFRDKHQRIKASFSFVSVCHEYVLSDA